MTDPSPPTSADAPAPEGEAQRRGPLARAGGPLLVAGIVALAFMSGLLISRWQGNDGVVDIPGFLWPDYQEIPAFALTDHDGAVFDHARLEGRWTVLFFGYTHCPDVCPVTLSVLEEMRAALPAAGISVDDLQVVMVSVDPARDSPKHLGEYVTYFDPAFLGVTGEPEALLDFTRSLGILYLANPPDENGSYLVDHSASVLLTDPRGNLVGVFSPPHEARAMAERFIRMRAVVEG